MQVPPIAIARRLTRLVNASARARSAASLGSEQHDEMEIAVADVTDDHRADAALVDVRLGLRDESASREIGTQASVANPWVPGLYASDA